MVSNFTVDFYREIDGKKPVGVFIRSLDIKMKAKVVANLHLLEEYGNLAREPISKELEDGIFELRTIEGNDLVRILYFFDKDKIIIATNGFIKKQQKTPKNEIALAKKRRTDYHRRKEAGVYE
ncbi:type II toxin-antitoxin system RelE/ParE family toxin [Butyrivibrio sp. YAB3001]|uniref:type II toxin-antitoxin system RelE/ParE family toxin n=1 Tax=Butyrivibrio sp. YAB3001 TaxID=1520812 RepID=UPI001588152D